MVIFFTFQEELSEIGQTALLKVGRLSALAGDGPWMEKILRHRAATVGETSKGV